MVEIEELELEDNPGEGLELEANPGELELEENPGEASESELDLEDNPGEESELDPEDNPGESDVGAHQTGAGMPSLESNLSRAGHAANDNGDSDDDDDDEWEIPFAEEDRGASALPDCTVVDVRLPRKGNERLGLVLDEANHVVALRESTPAAACGEIFVGDTVLAVQGVACTPEKRVALLLRELPEAATYVFTVRRALDATPSARDGVSGDVVDHGPLMTPEEMAAAQQREIEQRHEMREALKKSDDFEGKEALEKSLQPRNLRESKYLSSKTELTPEANKLVQGIWERQARGFLHRRLSAAEMVKDEGNEKFSEGEYAEALEEYDYALQLFAYEIANLCRDQQAAELGDHKRGLSSDDLPQIQKIRVPCLLNSAACHIKLGSRTHLTKALENCAEVLQACPPALQRAKAHFRMGQAHFALENYRESWTALVQSQALNPASREVRALQAKVSYELKQLKVAERESREGLMTTELNHRQLFKREKLSYAAKLQMLKKLLPEAGSAEEAKMEAETARRDKVESLLETVAAKGWTNLAGEQQMLFAAVWSAAQPRLRPGEVRDGRDAGVFPPRDEERVFGQNLPTALMAKPFPDRLAWLTPEQKTRARGLALTIWQRGLEDLDPSERRLCEGLELLSVSAHTAKCHQMPLGTGGAQLILSDGRRHKWAFMPKTLRVQDAIMGKHLPAAELADICRWARRPMEKGEVGIVQSNVACWSHALEQGWEWTLVLEDDAKVQLAGGVLQLLALLPELVASASRHDDKERQWQLLALTPYGLEPFYDLCEPSHIPSLTGDAAPAWARRPKTLGDTGWKRIGPTFHAFGWVYRAPLMRALVDAMERKAPPLNPVDVWVWEVMAANGMLGCALAPKQPLVTTSDTPGGVTSQRAQQGGMVV